MAGPLFRFNIDDMRYFILTYGCQMNKADSERIAQKLEKRKLRAASKIKEADLVVVNMCSVRQQAVDRVFGIPLKLAKLAPGRNPKLVLTGCILTKDKRKFSKVFDEVWDNKNHLDVVSKHKNPALIPISNGCNNWCTYCVVPQTRGKLVCRPKETILREIKSCVRSGAREIWLLGQNVNDYKSDTTDFVKLVKLVDDIPGNFKFFFTSPHPKNFSQELIDVLSKCKKYSRYLNLPVQSGDDAILKRMNRNYTAKQYESLVSEIRKKMPDINLSTDAIVGFPGETKKQFQNTQKLFKEIGFDIAYVSKYSPRPGTLAQKFGDDVPREEKKRRENILQKLTKHPSCPKKS